MAIVTSEKKCYAWGRNEFYELSYQGVAKIESAKPLKPRIDPIWKKKQKDLFSNNNSVVGSLQDLEQINFKNNTNTSKYISKLDIDAKNLKLDFISMKSVRNCSFYLTEQVAFCDGGCILYRQRADGSAWVPAALPGRNPEHRVSD